MNLADFQRAKSGKLALSLNPRAVWKFSGTDRLRYLNGQITNDLRPLKPGQALHAAVCSAKGKMEGDVWISATNESFYLDADASVLSTLGPRLEKYIIADDVTCEETGLAWKIYHIIGDTSPDPGTGGMVFASHRFGLPGHDIWLPAQAPAPNSASPEVRETLRITQGIPVWGREMTAATLPPEARLEIDAISYTKGCYIGQEVISRLKSVGHVNKQLCHLGGNELQVPGLPAPCFHEGREIGQATSAARHPETGECIILASLQRAFAQTGTTVEINGAPFQVRPFPRSA